MTKSLISRSSMLQLRHFVDRWKLTSKYIHICPRVLKNDNRFDYESKYSDVQEASILKVLNESSADNLSKFAISQARLKRIIDKRKTKGEIKSFSDILEVDGLGVKLMEKFCDSILGENNNNLERLKKVHSSVQRRIIIKGQILDPVLEIAQRKQIRSACSLIVNLNSIAWARMDRQNNELTDWKLHSFGIPDGKILKLSNISEIVWSVCRALPRSDVYVMEATSSVLRSAGADANNPRSISINLQKAQLIAMISAAINCMENCRNIYEPDSSTDLEGDIDTKHCNHLPEFDHKVFYLRATLASRMFKTFVGSEKVSPQLLVDNILNKLSGNINPNQEKVIKILENISPLNVEHYIKHYYSNLKDIDREILCHTLLLALTFMELCINMNPNALKNLDSFNSDF